MIQILTYSGEDKDYQENGIKVNSFHDAESLDCYEVNVIILNDEKMWVNKNDSTKSINCIKDLKSLYSMLKNCHKAKIVIVFPQNVRFLYFYGTANLRYGYKDYLHKSELKNMIHEMTVDILSVLYKPIGNLNIIYENTKTKIGSKQISAAFYFNNIDGNQCLTKSLGSEKNTTIYCGGAVLSTLDLKNAEEIFLFLKSIHI